MRKFVGRKVALLVNHGDKGLDRLSAEHLRRQRAVPSKGFVNFGAGAVMDD
jgi:hypothetical protein